MKKLTLRAATAFLTWEETPKGRRITTLAIVYVTTELERRGYLPAIPIPKP
jgi:hypothetical protein